MSFPKISDFLQEQGLVGTTRILSDPSIAQQEIIKYGKNKVINKAQEYVEDQLNRAVQKNREGINKILKFMGLDKGGMSNIYDKVAARPDPLFDFEFMVYMPAISTTWTYAPPLDSYWIEDIDVPLETFDTDQLKVNGHPVNVMMYSSQPEVTIQIYMDYANVAQAYFGSWYSSVRLPNGRYNLPYAANNTGYKKMIQVVIFKGNMPVAVLSLSGVMPTQRNGFESKSAGGDRRVYNQTLTVDKVYIQLLNAVDPTKTSVDNAGTIGGTIATNAIGALSGTISRQIRGF